MFRGLCFLFGPLLLPLAIPLSLLVWVLSHRHRQGGTVPSGDKVVLTVKGPTPASTALPDRAPTVEVEPEPQPLAPEPDDLQRIEGIGPKISSLLEASGIATFAQLADTSVDGLQRILDKAGLRLAHPGTWPEQARLAADGSWEAFEVLQRELKGGRRV